MGAYHFIGTNSRKMGRTAPSSSQSRGSSASRSSSVRGVSQTKSGATRQGEAVSNNISKFMSGMKSRGPHNGPSSRSLGNFTKAAQMKNTSAISDCPSPSSSSGARGSTAKVRTQSAPQRFDVMSENREPADPSRSVKGNSPHGANRGFRGGK